MPITKPITYYHNGTLEFAEDSKPLDWLRGLRHTKDTNLINEFHGCTQVGNINGVEHSKFVESGPAGGFFFGGFGFEVPYKVKKLSQQLCDDIESHFKILIDGGANFANADINKLRINLVGFSRGSIIQIMACKDALAKVIKRLKNKRKYPRFAQTSAEGLKKIITKVVDVNICALDPATGPVAILKNKTVTLSPLIKNFEAAIFTDPRKPFQNISPLMFKIEDPSITKISTASFNGVHITGNDGGNSEAELATKKLVHITMKRFLEKHGTVFSATPKMSFRKYEGKCKGRKQGDMWKHDFPVLEDKDELELYAETYEFERIGDYKRLFDSVDPYVDKKVIGFKYGPRFSELTQDLYRPNDLFLNYKEAEVFKRLYPNLFQYYFHKQGELVDFDLAKADLERMNVNNSKYFAKLQKFSVGEGGKLSYVGDDTNLANNRLVSLQGALLPQTEPLRNIEYRETIFDGSKEIAKTATEQKAYRVMWALGRYMFHLYQYQLVPKHDEIRDYVKDCLKLVALIVKNRAKNAVLYDDTEGQEHAELSSIVIQIQTKITKSSFAIGEMSAKRRLLNRIERSMAGKAIEFDKLPCYDSPIYPLKWAFVHLSDLMLYLSKEKALWVVLSVVIGLVGFAFALAAASGIVVFSLFNPLTEIAAVIGIFVGCGLFLALGATFAISSFVNICSKIFKAIFKNENSKLDRFLSIVFNSVMVVLSASLFIATIAGTIAFSLLNPLTNVTLVSGIFAAFIVIGTCSAVAALVSAVKVIHATCCCPKTARVVKQDVLRRLPANFPVSVALGASVHLRVDTQVFSGKQTAEITQ